jgi:hypothetical protein
LLRHTRPHDDAVDALRDELERERRARATYEARVRYLERWRPFGRTTRAEESADEGRAAKANAKAKDGVMV